MQVTAREIYEIFQMRYEISHKQARTTLASIYHEFGHQHSAIGILQMISLRNLYGRWLEPIVAGILGYELSDSFKTAKLNV